MIPQGQAIVNTAHLSSLIESIDSIDTCEALQEVVSDAFASIQAQQTAILAQLQTIQPLLALLQAPTSLTALINWVKTFITSFLTPYLKPYITYAAQVAELTQQVVQLSAAIQSAASRIQSCSINIPSLEMPDLELPPIEFPPPSP